MNTFGLIQLAAVPVAGVSVLLRRNSRLAGALFVGAAAVFVIAGALASLTEPRTGSPPDTCGAGPYNWEC